jgi:hypothetical protein
VKARCAPRHRRLASLAARVLVAAFAVAGAIGGTAGASERPNILFIVTDDQRVDNLTCAGQGGLSGPAPCP